MKQIITEILKEISIFILSVIISSIFLLCAQIILGIFGELGMLNFLESSGKTGQFTEVFCMVSIISLALFLVIGLPNKKHKIFFRDICIICLFYYFYMLACT
ncbi:MAG: hypothetical protein IKS41_06170 [Alphaproteobacteria bacterium]|nr:hypothetical protein [Alphaproteobacteria bacterium]